MFVIDTDKLEIGRPLRFDLTTVDGHLIATAGTCVTDEHKSDWIERGFKRVCSYVESEYANQPEQLRPYNPVMVQRLEANLHKASEAVEELSRQVSQHEPASSVELQNFAENILADVEMDVAAVLAVALGAETVDLSDDDCKLAKRCSRMSVLSMAVGAELGFSAEDKKVLGIAGLLHDISLLSVTKSAVERISSTLPFNNQFLDHSTASEYLLESILGLDKKICVAVAQVHEQPNGGGFPKGLQSHRIMPISRLLSIVDAYLTLTAESQPEPLPKGLNLQPCDAVAYLMHNVTKGRFDADAIKGLVRSLSLYPIGSHVQLSDGSQAIVLRSNQQEPSKPIVRMNDASFTIVDLRETSLKITQPLNKDSRHMNRISRTDLDEVLFR